MNMDEMNPTQGGEDQNPATAPSEGEAPATAPEGMPTEGETPAAPAEGGESTE